MADVDFLIGPLWQAFAWLDDGLTNYLRFRGWPHLTRSQTLVLNLLVAGVCRSSDLARSLRVTRQAMHVTIRQILDLGFIEIGGDATDGRSKIIGICQTGNLIQQDIANAMRLMLEELRARIGEAEVKSLIQAFAADWGTPLSWG